MLIIVWEGLKKSSTKCIQMDGDQVPNSRSLASLEEIYSAHQLEFLALNWAVTEKFHDYSQSIHRPY